MRGCLLCLFVALSGTVCFSSECDDRSLKGLYDSHQLFELRRAVNQGHAPPFYQSIIACSFNDLHGCARELETVVQTAPRSNEARQARMNLAAAYFRSGRYREALSQVDTILRGNPDDPAKEQRPLLTALARLPEQVVIRRGPSNVRSRGWGEGLAIPVSINGRPATYAFDTGNFAVAVSRSEAKRIRLAIYDTDPDAKVNGLSIKVGLAKQFAVGNFSFKNVAFIVFPDDQEPFSDMREGERGLIGLPTLLAFQNFSWAADKTFEFGLPISKSVSEPNIAFDEQYVLAQVNFGSSKLTFGLDTGGETTTLTPRFAQTFADIVKRSGQKGTKTEAEIGSVTRIDSIVLPQVAIRIGGHPTILRQAHILVGSSEAGCRYGNLGMDLLKQSQKTAVDFKAMTLTMH